MGDRLRNFISNLLGWGIDDNPTFQEREVRDDCACHGCRLDREAAKYAEDDIPA